MKGELQKAIDDNCGELYNYIDPLTLLGDGLLSNIDIKGPKRARIRIFSEEDYAVVQARVGTKLQLSCLLSIISKKPDQVFDWFISHLCKEGKHNVARKVWDSSDKEGSMEQFLGGNTCQTVETQTDTSSNQSMVPSPQWLLNHVTNNVDSSSVLYISPGAPAALFKTGMNEILIENCLLRHFMCHYNFNVVHSTVQLLNSMSKSHNMVWSGVTSVPEDDLRFIENIKIKFQGQTYSFEWDQDTPDWEEESPASIESYLRLVGLEGRTAAHIVEALERKFNGEWRCIISSSKDNHDISGAGGVVCNIRERKVIIHILKIKNRITGINRNAKGVPEFNSIITNIIESNHQLDGICYKVKDALQQKYTQYHFVVITNGYPNISYGTPSYGMNSLYVGNVRFTMYINFMLKSEANNLPLPNTMVDDFKQQLNDPVKSEMDLAIKLYDYLEQQYGGKWNVFCGSGHCVHAAYFSDWKVPPLRYHYSPHSVDSNPPDLSTDHYCHVVRLGGQIVPIATNPLPVNTILIALQRFRNFFRIS